MKVHALLSKAMWYLRLAVDMAHQAKSCCREARVRLSRGSASAWWWRRMAREALSHGKVWRVQHRAVCERLFALVAQPSSAGGAA